MMMLYAGLGIITNTESPIVVVLRFVHRTLYKTYLNNRFVSGSMEPAFQRGDILFLTNPIERVYKNGDIVVYNVPGRPIPIVHRVLEIHEMHTFESPATQPSKLNIVRQPNNPSHERLQLMLTKGDNNLVDDIELYNGLEWINHEHVVGRVRGYVNHLVNGSAYTHR